MLRRSEIKIRELETTYSGISEQIRRFEDATLPCCELCGSQDTANVQVGVVGRTIAIACATTKIKLIPNGPPAGDFYCNACSKFFGQKN